jgi:ribosomal protein S17
MTGKVTSNKMTKALIVTVERTKIHPKYQKRFKVRKRYAVACEDSSAFEIGQVVQITECPPVSKTIRFKVTA